MPKSTVKTSIHTNCIGTRREGKPIMLSLDGKNSQGTYVYLDAFLTKEEAQELMQELQNTINSLKELQ